MNRSDIVEFSDTVEIIEECYRLGWRRRPAGGPAGGVQGAGDAGDLRHDRRGGDHHFRHAPPRAHVGKRRRQRRDGGVPARVFPRPYHRAADAGRGKELRQHGRFVHKLAGHPDDRQRPHPPHSGDELPRRHLRPRQPGQRLYRAGSAPLLHERLSRPVPESSIGAHWATPASTR